MKRLQFCVWMVMLLGLLGCSGDKWEGIVFTDRDNLLMYHATGEVETLEKCKDASMKMLKNLDALDKGFYECGKNCKAGSNSYERGCEETERGNVYR